MSRWKEHHKMQNKLMTKAEAVEVHAKTQHNAAKEYYNITKAKSEKFVEGLIALGLIEFKEEQLVKRIDIQNDELVNIYCNGKIVYTNVT